MGINWNEMLSGNFIKLEDGVPKTLLISNWRAQDKFKDEKTDELKKGIELDVWKEDNAEFDETTLKSWTVTSIRAMSKLKPIIEQAEAKGQEKVLIQVVRVGTGKKTEYSIKLVEEQE